MGGIEQRAELVRLYLCVVRAKIEPGCYPNEEPMPKKARGSSRPPVSEDLLVLMKLNATAASVLDPLIESLKRTNTSILGYRCDAMLWRLYEHPGSETRWSDMKRRAFWKMCQLIAKASLEADSREFSVYASSSGVAGVGEGSASTKVEGRKQDVRDSYRRVVAEIERVEEDTKKPREEVKRLLRDEKGWSLGRQNDALAFVKRERGENGNGHNAA